MNYTYLDLRQVSLFGWEQFKSDKVIELIIQSITDGFDFPPVYVEMIDDKTFQIARKTHPKDNKRLDGGHHRAYAHFLAAKPLKCIIERRVPKLTEKYKISSINLVPDNEIVRGIYNYQGRKVPVISLAEFQSREKVD